MKASTSSPVTGGVFEVTSACINASGLIPSRLASRETRRSAMSWFRWRSSTRWRCSSMPASSVALSCSRSLSEITSSPIVAAAFLGTAGVWAAAVSVIASQAPTRAAPARHDHRIFIVGLLGRSGTSGAALRVSRDAAHRGQREVAMRRCKIRPTKETTMSHEHEIAARTEVRDGMRITWHQPIEMDDGTVLRADVFRPVDAGVRVPVILSYGVYAKGLAFQDGY